MKQIFKFSFALLAIAMLFSLNNIFAQGGAAVNNSGDPAHASAMLDISSNSKGLLVPRMTLVQREAIVNPAVGLMVYQTDDVTQGFWHYDGTAWVQAIGPAGATGPAGADGATGNDGATGPTGFIQSGNVPGNTPYWDGSNWVVNSSNIYNNGGSIGIGTTMPDASAKLDVSSTAQGFLLPRMSEVQRTSIASAAEGLIVYQTDGTAGFYYFDGTSWTQLGGGGGGGAADPTLLYTIDGF